MSLAIRSYEKELLDQDDIPFSDILGTMQELNVINTLLGGHSITRDGIDFFLDDAPHDKQLTIAEIGCGGGDNLSAIHKFLSKIDRPASLIGGAIEVAERKYPHGFLHQRSAPQCHSVPFHKADHPPVLKVCPSKERRAIVREAGIQKSGLGKTVTRCGHTALHHKMEMGIPLPDLCTQ